MNKKQGLNFGFLLEKNFANIDILMHFLYYSRLKRIGDEWQKPKYVKMNFETLF